MRSGLPVISRRPPSHHALINPARIDQPSVEPGQITTSVQTLRAKVHFAAASSPNIG
jgi:hypothetical protein